MKWTGNGNVMDLDLNLTKIILRHESRAIGFRDIELP